MTLKEVLKTIYKRNTHLAKSYFACLGLRKLMDQGTSGIRFSDEAKAENGRKIAAIEKALDSLPDDNARALVVANLFEGVPMHSITLPYSVRTMKRIRAAYIDSLAREMGEL